MGGGEAAVRWMCAVPKCSALIPAHMGGGGQALALHGSLPLPFPTGGGEVVGEEGRKGGEASCEETHCTHACPLLWRQHGTCLLQPKLH